LSVLGGVTGPSLVLPKAKVAAALVLAAAIAVVGCGEAGVAEDATVTAYVAAPLCADAELELSRARGRVGELRVEAVCLPNPRRPGKLDLATIGANARRATEDSTSVAYLEAFDPPANRFSEPILESAELAGIYRSSGEKAMARLLRAIEAWDSGSLRESVRDSLPES
jgi:hypothetical protein